MATGIERPTLSADPQAVQIILVTADAAAAYTRAVEAGATPLDPPTTRPWGQVTCYLRDPQGRSR